MRLSDAAIAMQGECLGQDQDFSQVSIDTRQLTSGDLYFALKGQRFDGHDYVAAAYQQKACAAVINRAQWPILQPVIQSLLAQQKMAVILVTDTRLALGALAKAWQQAHPIRRVALTGSCGKTTVKEMIAAILRTLGPVLATVGNLNNDIGAPLTLLKLTHEHQYGVFELGANHRGEIDYTSDLVQPQIALITNADRAHLEGFGSVAQVAQAKAEIFNHLVPQGIAVINIDDPHGNYWREYCREKRVMTFSAKIGAQADYQLIASQSAGYLGSHLRIQTPAGELQLTLPLIGRHQWANALASVAVTHILGATFEQIRLALLTLKPVPGRLNPRQMTLPGTADSCLVIDDTYNANPFSVRAAIDVLAECNAPKILILGDMGELGDASAVLHQEIGAYAKSQGIDALFAVGHYALYTQKGFGSDSIAVETQDQLRPYFKQMLEKKPSAILIKGSRSAKMERVVEVVLAFSVAEQSMNSIIS